MVRAFFVLIAAVIAAESFAQSYPLTPSSPCGADGYACWQIVDLWNKAMTDDIVDETFDTAGPALAAVRWYTTEFPCTGVLCSVEMHTDGGPGDPLAHRFTGVTDELSNALIARALGSDREAFERMRNFTELLRLPHRNDLQCWMYYIDGPSDYDSYDDVCIRDDSASDASLRILGAYGIACGKQQAGLWPSTVDYCADYVRQGNAIWGRGTAMHGEVRELSNGEFFLANGFNNQGGAPTNEECFRPDYYELQFLYDFGDYVNDAAVKAGVLDMLKHYSFSMGTNKVHRSKNGHFAANPDSSNYVVDAKAGCGGDKECVDQVDTWRAIPALGALLAVRPDAVTPSLKSGVFDEWWNRYGAANYPAGGVLPFEIYANAADGGVYYSENSYKTIPMWMPLGVAYSASYTTALVSALNGKFDRKQGQFNGAAYYGGYYSSWAQRAIGIATGMLDRRTASSTTTAPCCLDATKRENGIELTWRPASGVNGYEILRSTNGAWSVIGTSSTPHYLDLTTSAGNVYVYEVRGTFSPSGNTASSNREVASTLQFDDDPLIAHFTPVRASHVTQLQQGINKLRAAAGLSEHTFPPLGTFAQASAITEMRDALSPALSAVGTPPLTNHFFAAGQTIERWHLQELRDRLR